MFHKTLKPGDLYLVTSVNNTPYSVIININDSKLTNFRNILVAIGTLQYFLHDSLVTPSNQAKALTYFYTILEKLNLLPDDTIDDIKKYLKWMEFNQ